MNRRMTLFIAILLCVVAVLMIRRYIDNLRASYQKEPAVVAVAARNLSAGTVLAPEMVRFETGWPAELRPSTSFNRSSIKLAYGQQLLTDIPKGDPILSGFLTQPRPVEPLAEMLGPGERAITLSADELSGLFGMIRPGDHIDILGTFDVRFVELLYGQDLPEENIKQQAEYTFTYTLLQDVTVLAVDDLRPYSNEPADKSSGGNYSTITVSVTPREARLIVFALQKGELTFALRPPEDTTILESEEELEVMDVPSMFDFLVQETRNRKRRITVKQGVDE